MKVLTFERVKRPLLPFKKSHQKEVNNLKYVNDFGDNCIFYFDVVTRYQYISYFCSRIHYASNYYDISR